MTSSTVRHLRSSSVPLAELYDVALLDLDGVVYVGAHAVARAPEALAAARGLGMRLAFVTNNAARPPLAVVEHLRELGIPARVDEVITSAQAAAHFLARELEPGARVLVVGTTGLIEALTERGLTPVFTADEHPVAVAQGYSPQLDWKQLAEGAIAIRAGARWVATNLDATVPSARGPLPGNGSLVAALVHATGRTPLSTGKPDPTMHAETVERSGAQRPIVVGDRLDTDIEGATRVGCPSLLVLSGVTDPVHLLRASAGRRPDYIADDLDGLLVRHPVVSLDPRPATARCRQWTVTVKGTELLLARSDQDQADAASSPTADTQEGERSTQLDALRALCALSWTTMPTRLLAGDEQARRTLIALGLDEGLLG